jgi:hypothetical protein
MTTVSSVPLLSPYSQLKQVAYSVGSLLLDLCERADAVFERVTVRKKDETGQFKTYDILQNDGTKVKADALNYFREIKTGNLYLPEEDSVIRTKCALIALGMPFYTVGSMAINLVHSALKITAVAIDTFMHTLGKLFRGNFQEGGEILSKGVSLIGRTAGVCLFEVIKAPLFGVGCELAALYGIVKPHHGRKYEGLIENAWQQGVSYKLNEGRVPHGPGDSCLQEFAKEKQEASSFYLAQCFQIRGNTNESRITVVSQEPLYSNH